MPADVTMIGEVPIFGLLDDEERDALAHMMDTRDFKQGETIFEYGGACPYAQRDYHHRTQSEHAVPRKAA